MLREGGCARAAARVHRRSATRRIPAAGAGRRGAYHGVRSVGCFAGSGVRQPLGALRPSRPGGWRDKRGPRRGGGHGGRGQWRLQAGGHHRSACMARMALGMAHTGGSIAPRRGVLRGVCLVDLTGAMCPVRVCVVTQVQWRVRPRRGGGIVATVGRCCGPKGVQRHPQQQENGHQAGPGARHERILRARHASLAGAGLLVG